VFTILPYSSLFTYAIFNHYDEILRRADRVPRHVRGAIRPEDIDGRRSVVRRGRMAPSDGIERVRLAGAPVAHEQEE
jgi:hypothetical protein